MQRARESRALETEQYAADPSNAGHPGGRPGSGTDRESQQEEGRR